MNIVRAALNRPMSLLVLVFALALTGFYSLTRMPRDIFPDLGVPVIYVAQTYGGMDPAKMEGYLTYYYEYHFLYITGIENVESKSIQGVSLIKLQFHPGTDMAQALAETISYANRARAFMPEGAPPPFVMRFDAGSVPVGNLVFTSNTRTVGELQDAALNRVRPLFATLPGVSAPPPFGASQRTIVIRADPDKLRAFDMAPDELVRAVSAGNAVVPSGNVRIGDSMPLVPINSVVGDIGELRNVPIRSMGAQTIFLRDVATVEDASDIQTGYGLVNGRRTVYIPVTKRADASTLSVVNLVKENLPKFKAAVPNDVEVTYEFDQSPYVTRAITSLMIEGALSAILTGLAVLLFLRSWRSALVVVLNIPLALLAASLALWLSGQTINIMTLGGLALSVGILVDQATVAIENIHTHRSRGVNISRAACDGTTETLAPQLLAMLSILAVFTPALFMSGAARNLFQPLAMAVGFAMVGSYLLSSTLVPILAIWLLPKDEGHSGEPRFLARIRTWYANVNPRLVDARRMVVAVYATGAIVVTVALFGFVIGTEIFPAVDSGQFSVRMRAPTGTRIERTEQIALRTLDIIKREVGADNVEITLGFVGVQPPNYPINTIYLWTAGSEEAVFQIQLKSGSGIGITELQERLRQKLPQELAGVKFAFEPSDIVSRVMSFGAPKPIEVAISGPNLADTRAYAEKLLTALSKNPALRDVELGQALDYPSVRVNVDRERAGVMGVTMSDVAKSVVAATSSSRYTAANYWADQRSGIAYQVQVAIPESRMNSIEEVKNIPVKQKGGHQIGLRNVADITSVDVPGEYARYNNQRMLTVNANIHGEDLGTAAAQVEDAVRSLGTLPPGLNVDIRGQIVPMNQLFSGLRLGLAIAVVVIFLLMAANFQSLGLALAIILTTPAVVAGVGLALVLTGTTLNIQSFMGAIMAMGVAVANAILLVTFAERNRAAGHSPDAAALEGASSRLRPILMTSAAMIAGMLPMAVGSAETAPLARAVIGGLIAATAATLLVLPALFTLIQEKWGTGTVSLNPYDPDSVYFEPRVAHD